MQRTVCLLALLSLPLGFAATAVAEPTETAMYRVRFQSFWSPQSHPDQFPPGPHFSPLIGGVHDGTVEFWAPGEFASPGIEEMAERGQVSPLDDEVEAAISAGGARSVVRGGGIANSPGSVQTTFEVSLDHPLLTLVTMIAPSPDWFVGVHGTNLLVDGDWARELNLMLLPYDAGTDDGATYTSSDLNASPPQPISRIQSGPAGNGVAFGMFTLTRLDVPESEPLLLRSDRFAARATWLDLNGTRGDGHPVGLTDETGWFWFFDPANLEMVVKVLDGCVLNGHYWVFAAGLTDVEVTFTVEDTMTEQVSEYANPLGTSFLPILDTTAFATCP